MKAIVFAACLVAAGAFSARASTATCATLPSGDVSCAGALSASDDYFEHLFTIPGLSPVSITLQTYGFGGGVNAAGNAIASGGFDPLVALFSNDSPELVLTDGLGNSLASIPGTTQFYAGCPPAGTVAIGAESVCGDSTLIVSLAPGSYNLIVSDAGYMPWAVLAGSGSLAGGFADLTGGVFQTCTSGGDCITPSANFAVDIVGLPPAPTSTVPEPASIALVGSSLAIVLRKRIFGK